MVWQPPVPVISYTGPFDLRVKRANLPCLLFHYTTKGLKLRVADTEPAL